MKKRNILVNLIFLFVLVFALNVNVSAQETEVPEGYTGIYTIADLWGIRNDTAGKYILMNDIDLTEATKEGGDWDTGHGWDPISTFSGVFDGNGYRIIGMNIYGDIEGNIGLFSSIKGGLIKNLSLTNTKIDLEYSLEMIDSYVGVLAGYCNNNTIIENVYVEGDIQITGTKDYQYFYIGGITGYFVEGSISNCINAVNINLEYYARQNSYVGGISGIILGNRACHEGLNVIENCYSIGKLESNKGARRPTAYKNDSVGIEIKNCYYDSESIDSSVTPVSGEKALTHTMLKSASSYTGFDFKNTWEIDEYCKYPYAQLKENRCIRVEKIELISSPSKTTYYQGENLSLNGSVIKLYYEDGYDSTIVPTKDMLSDYDMNKIGTQTIEICHGGKNVSFDIVVEGIPASSIKLNQTEIEIQKGKTEKLVASILPENAVDKTVEWSSEDSLIATVDQYGLVTAKNVGETVIKATTANGLIAKCCVAVKIPSIQLFLDKEQIEIMKGDTEILNATLAPLDSTDQIIWSSDNTQIATVIDGTVIGKQAGKTTVRAKTDSGIVKTCTVIVKQSLSEFKVEGIEDKQYTGGQIKQNINVHNENCVLKEGEDYTVSYNNNINVGTATVIITAKEEGNYIGNKRITFVIQPKEISIQPEEITVVHNSYEHAGFNYYYTGNEIKPTLSLKGLEEGVDYTLVYKNNVNVGTATVTMIFQGNYSGSYEYHFSIVERKLPEKPKPPVVTPKPVKVTSVKISGNSQKIAAGKKVRLTAKVYPSNATKKTVKWYSSNTKVATVTQNGIVTLNKKSGGKSVTISAIAMDGSGKKAIYKITSMKGYVKKITLSGIKSVTAGKSISLKAKVTATSGANKKLIWSSSNIKYAKVSSSGKVTTLKSAKGKSVKITAMATDGTGKKAIFTIKLK